MLGFPVLDRRLKTPLIVVTVAVFIAIVEAAGIVDRSTDPGNPAEWITALRTGLVLWLTMAMAAPIPIAMARRFPLEGGAVLRRLPLHVLAAVAFVIGHLYLDIVFQTLQGNMQPEPLARHLRFLMSHYLATEMLIYAAVAGALMFVQARSEAEARARAADVLRAELGEARLAALRSQIAPHFLFNTLNAISTLALRGDGPSVGRALATLAGLLRFVLDDPAGHEVELREELDFLDRYLELQQLRFPDRLTVSWDIAETTREARIPRLLLQPIVENAVRHGLQDSGTGEVAVSAQRDRDVLVLEVRDRRAISAPGLERGEQADGIGIGLVNSRARLATLYGDAQSLEMIREESGVTVRIQLPFRSRGSQRTA